MLRTGIRTNAWTHAHTHAQVSAHTGTRMHACTVVRMHGYTHTSTHARTRARARARARSHTHDHVHHKYAHTCALTHPAGAFWLMAKVWGAAFQGTVQHSAVLPLPLRQSCAGWLLVGPTLFRSLKSLFSRGGAGGGVCCERALVDTHFLTVAPYGGPFLRSLVA